MGMEDVSAGPGTNWWRVTGWGIAAAVLLLPLAAMQLTGEVNWTAGDFLFAGVMVGSAGLAIELAVRRHRQRSSRLGVLLLTGTLFALSWINAAVGIVGDGHEAVNLFYPGVVMLALAAAAAGRFDGMALAWASAAAAGAVAVMGGVATALAGPADAAGTVAFHGVFVAALLVAAALFRRAPAR